MLFWHFHLFKKLCENCLCCPMLLFIVGSLPLKLCQCYSLLPHHNGWERQLCKLQISKTVSELKIQNDIYCKLTFGTNKYNHEAKLLSGRETLWKLLFHSFSARRSCKRDTTSKGIIYRRKMSHISYELLDGHWDRKYNQRCTSKIQFWFDRWTSALMEFWQHISYRFIPYPVIFFLYFFIFICIWHVFSSNNLYVLWFWMCANPMKKFVEM